MTRRPRRNHTPGFKILWGVDSDRRSGGVRLLTHPLWRRRYKFLLTGVKLRPLSARSWRDFRLIGTQSIDLVDYITVARRGEKLSKHSVRGGDVAGLIERFGQLREKARARTAEIFPLVVIQEAGLDGFWIHRVLQAEGIERHVVDPASIATSRRRRTEASDTK